MKKVLFFVACFCVGLMTMQSTAWAASQDIFAVKINVPKKDTPMATLKFSAVNDKYGRLDHLATQFGNETFLIPQQLLRSSTPSPISYQGTQMLTVQGYSTNAQGEGYVRIRIEQTFVGAGVNPVLDLEMRQLGPDKRWITLVNKKAATGADLSLNMDPATQSALSMLMSPPQIVKSNVNFVSCSSQAIAKGVKDYETSEYAQKSGCR